MAIAASPDYLTRASREADAIAPYWPAAGYRLLDIGCGLGAVDTFLWERCPVTDIHLLDGEGPGPKAVYTDGSYAWNDVQDAAVYVRSHTRARVHTHRLTDAFPAVDVVISLRSWCHHYPAQVYLDRVVAALTPGGVLVCDCRVDSGNYDALLRAGFAPVTELEQSYKRRRVVWRKR